jgi:hypothetical protein
MRPTISLVLCAVLTACASGYQQFYKPYTDANTLPEVKVLAPEEAPKVYASNDLDRDVKIAQSKGYLVIGVSSFNGKLESEDAVIQQARRVGALLVLVNSKFTDTRTITTPLFLPNNQTTYSSGSVYGTYGSANYSGSSTIYGSTVVPMTTHQQRYDQTAVYFVKSTRKLKFGLSPVDLPQDLRGTLERNTGALIDIVFEDTPAFAANVLPGDVLIELDGVSVINAKHAGELMQSASPADGRCVLKVIRSGKERTIELKLNGS